MSRPGYELFGKTPATVFEPETVDDVRQAVRDSAGLAMAPWGGGTRQQLGYSPARYDAALSLAKLNGVVAYEPDDLTLTVQAGATMAQIDDVLAGRNQRLAVQVPLPRSATLGGAIATRADSLLRFSGGSLRDAILGVTVVNSAAELIKGGGRVVKNVAGYDLPKLYCGSMGTLGAIVEATLRVVPKPEATATVLLPLPAGRNSEEAIDALLASELRPAFLYLAGAAAAEVVIPKPSLGPGSQHLILGIDGSKEAVEWQLNTLNAPGGVLNEREATEVRAALRDFPADYSEISCCFHLLSSQVGAYLRMMEWTAGRSGFKARVVADAAVGMMWAHFSPESGDSDWSKFAVELADKAQRCGGSFIVEKMPDSWRAGGTPVWSPILPDFGLMKSLKSKFDPAGMWNPGRFIGGI